MYCFFWQMYDFIGLCPRFCLLFGHFASSEIHLYMLLPDADLVDDDALVYGLNPDAAGVCRPGGRRELSGSSLRRAARDVVSSRNMRPDGWPVCVHTTSVRSPDCCREQQRGRFFLFHDTVSVCRFKQT